MQAMKHMEPQVKLALEASKSASISLNSLIIFYHNESIAVILLLDIFLGLWQWILQRWF